MEWYIILFIIFLILCPILYCINCCRPKSSNKAPQLFKKYEIDDDLNILASQCPITKSLAIFVEFNDNIDIFKNLLQQLLNVTSPINVIVKIKSLGGSVEEYGLIHSMIKLLKKHYFIALIDEYAASGGYLIASVCNEIYAAEFAQIGSIGVIIENINYHDLLQKLGIKNYQITSGRYKRQFGKYMPITEDEIKYMQDESDKIHKLFQHHIKENRPQVDITLVNNGALFRAYEAKKLNLIDHIKTSYEFMDTFSVFHTVYRMDSTKTNSITQKILNLV